MTYKKGDTCKSGQIIDIILGDSDIASVFTTDDNHLRWEYYANNKVVPDWLRPSIIEFDVLMSQIKLTIKDKAKTETYYRLGKALYASLMTQTESNLKDYFKSIRDYIKSKANEKARISYVFSGIVSFIIIAIVGYYVYTWLQKSDSPFSILVYGAVYGTFGSLLSVIIRNDSLNVDPYSSKKYICFQAIFRLITGMLAGFLLGIAIKAEIALSAYKENLYLIAFASIAAGFTERFIPEFISKTEEKLKNANP